MRIKNKNKMKYNGKLTNEHIYQLVYCFREKINNTHLKNIYFYENRWLFKFSNCEFIVEGSNIQPGNFVEREKKKLHSLCIKLRKELNNRKCISVEMFNNDRTICFIFHDFILVIELYAKGNIVLLEKETKNIIILTRIYKEITHNNEYQMKDFVDYNDFVNKLYNLSGNKLIEDSNGLNIYDTLLNINNIVLPEKIKKEKKRRTPLENIENQVLKYEKQINKCETDLEKYNWDDFNELNSIHQSRKKIQKKKESAISNKEILQQQKKIPQKIEKKVFDGIKTSQWYYKYHWWITKNNFLVVGGKSADDNERLVKNYLTDNDYYFHSDDFGSGSFILFCKDNSQPDSIDLDETAEGVLALSKNWGLSGNVYYVKGNQVSKTPPSGETLSKGSFMIYGKRNYIKIHSTTLGYVLVNQNELMLAPYRVCQRINKNCIKIVHSSSKTKTKIITKLIESKLKVSVPNDFSFFSKNSKYT